MKAAFLQLYWSFQRWRLRCLGCKVGSDVKINGRPAVRIRSGGRILIGDGASINCTRRSNPLNTESSTSFYVGAGAHLEIQKGAGISGSQLIAHASIVIGEETLIGAGSLICDSDMHQVPLGGREGIRSAPIEIGKRVFVGTKSLVLKGVTIGDGAVVAAGSVVTRDVPELSLAAGNPAKVMKRYPLSITS